MKRPPPLRTSSSHISNPSRKPHPLSLSISIHPPSPPAKSASPSLPHPISASFFTPINPLLPSRHATLHLTPQYIFPSALNTLPHHLDLEIPYAVNHHTLSFHWTRADALVDAIWNVWARPPCLNCAVACREQGGEVEDGDLARGCDLGERRLKSFGTVLECTRCAREDRAGGKKGSCCVEQIEVRRDGSVSASLEDLTKDPWPRMGMGSVRERRLRKWGVVGWRPINLHVGDVEGKREVVRQWQGLRDRSWSSGEKENWALPTRPWFKEREHPRRVAEAREEVFRDLESVEAKKARLHRAAARVAEWDREDLLLGIEAEDSPVQARWSADDELKNTTIQIERMCSHPTELESQIAEQKTFWRSRIQAERIHRGEEELERRDLEAAVKAEDAWMKEGDRVLEEVDEMWELVLRGRAEGAAEVELSGRVWKVLSSETREWLDHLVPRIWDALGI